MKNILFLFVLAIEMSFLSVNAQEKVKSPKPAKEYVVLEKSRQIGRLEIRRNTKSMANIVEIETQSIIGGNVTKLGGAPIPTPEITNLEAMVGSYTTKREVSRSGRAVIIRLSDVVFPLRLRFTVSDRQVVEVELKESGTWNIVAGIAI